MEVVRSHCCGSPIFMDVKKLEGRVGESQRVELIYKCEKCEQECGFDTEEK